jgi:hypothetical protein
MFDFLYDNLLLYYTTDWYYTGRVARPTRVTLAPIPNSDTTTVVVVAAAVDAAVDVLWQKRESNDDSLPQVILVASSDHNLEQSFRRALPHIPVALPCPSLLVPPETNTNPVHPTRSRLAHERAGSFETASTIRVYCGNIVAFSIRLLVVTWHHGTIPVLRRQRRSPCCTYYFVPKSDVPTTKSGCSRR